MCSILGVGFQRNHVVFNKRLVHKLVTKLLIKGMARGTTATGLCYTSSEEIVIVKNKVDATEFTKSELYKDSLEKYACFEGSPKKYLLSVIGHCRQKTKGTELNNDNNHPITCGDVVGIHNGMILNDDTQFDRYKSVLTRKAQVDSEIIFALINHFVKKLSSISKGIQQACKDLTGSYACAMVHRSQPHTLWLFRTNNPCTIYHFKEKGIIVFSSLESFMTDTVPEYTFGPYNKISFDLCEGIGIDLYNHKYQRFDLDVPTTGRSL